MLSLTSRPAGMSLVECLVTLAIGAVLMLSLTRVLNGAIAQHTTLAEKSALTAEARFALDRIDRQLRVAPVLLLPAPNSIGGVLAFALDPGLDTDGDGYADADNDKDGRVNEDPGDDRFANSVNGLFGLDDDRDGVVDETDVGSSGNDDEDSQENEDAINGVDDDGDGWVDEDPGGDANADGCPGVCGVDDDADGTIDEGDIGDDDEDGSISEDWLDVLVINRFGDSLIEAWPQPGAVDGRSFTQRPIAEGVSAFTVQRSTQNGAWESVSITLETIDDFGEKTVFSRSLSRRMP